MALSQGLYQKMLQKLSPQQIQLMKLLQVPTANIEQRIKEELEENPALELDSSEDNFEEDYKDEFESNDYEDEVLDGSEDEYENIDLSEYVSEFDDDIADYKTKDENYGREDDEDYVVPIKNETSFYDSLQTQLNLLYLNDHQYKIAEQIIGSLDDDGNLRRETLSIVDDLAFRQNIFTSEEEVNELIKAIQQFEPAGIAAHDLKECLLLQLNRLAEEKTETNYSIAIQIIEKHFDDFIKKHFSKIQDKLKLSELEIKNALNQITSLNPKPGAMAVESNINEGYVIPDFIVVNNNGILELSLNSRNAPELRISSDYKEMMIEYEKGSKNNKNQKEAVQFIKQKIDNAKSFIDMIKQRQETLSNTMSAILNKQKQYFLTGDETELQPMILKDISEVTGLDISTISRVVNSKFVQTEFGTIKLKFFFSEAMTTESGEEVSTREIKKILSDVVEAENKLKPIADEELTEILKSKGYNIARRTVAKYREQLNIPVARLRKQTI